MIGLRRYLSLRGRMRRRDLILLSFLPFVAVMTVADLADSTAAATAAWALVAWPVLVAHPWQRLHDLGRSGRWHLLFLAFYALGFAFFLREYVPSEGGWAALFDGAPSVTVDDALTASGLGGLSTLLIFLTIEVAWLYFFPGQGGANRFGPDPKGARDPA